MINNFSNRLRTRAQRRDLDQGGFTLVELLVVITILGILAAVVVFSVAGLGDKGKAAAIATDASTIRTAEEAYFAQNGSYGTMAQLVSGKFLREAATYNSVVVAPDAKSYVIGNSTSTDPAGGTAVVLAASNTTAPFNYMAPSFIANHSPGFTATYGSTGSFVTTITASTAPNPSDHTVLFFSADRVSAENLAASKGLSAAVAYTQGQLGIVSCNGQTPLTISGVSGACASTTTQAQALTAALADTANCSVTHTAANLTASDVVSLLSDSCWTAHGVKISIATPGGSSPNIGSTCGTTGGTAPYGCAAMQALENNGMSDATFQAIWGARIISGSNVSTSLTNVRNGSVALGFTPASFLISPSGNEQNPWKLVSQSGNYNPIMQYALLLNHGTAAEQQMAADFLAYVRSGTGQAVMAAFGYLPIP